ncbi:methyltransferase FkbM [Tanacetum coccineum]
MKSEGKNGVFVDVGANVGMATFAAAVMGFRVYSFEPVFENLQSICNGIYFNRVGELVTVFEAATSDRVGNITFHKVLFDCRCSSLNQPPLLAFPFWCFVVVIVAWCGAGCGELVEFVEYGCVAVMLVLVGRLDNSAVSASGAKLAFKSNEAIELQVRTVPLDLVIPEKEPVLLIKIDVQGWELHVLKGAKKLLSRKKGEAPYLIYEEDERLLQASNSSSKEIRQFLHGLGYTHCVQQGTDAHCTK